MAATDIGARIRAARKMRGFTVRKLADEVKISVSLLEKIERGERPPSSSLATQLAKALKVGPDHLQGQPYLNGSETEDQVHAVIPLLNDIMLTYDAPAGMEVAPRPIEVLAAETRTVSRMRRDGHYAQIGPLLPPLLVELTHLALSSEGRQREQAFWWLATAYRAANSLAHKLGYHHLSMTAVDRVRWAGERSGDPYVAVMADYLRLGAMLRRGQWASATALMVRMENDLYRLTDGRWDDTSRGLLGSIKLKDAVMRARGGNIDAGLRILEDAEEIAAASGGRDGVYYETSFGPSNIRIHEFHIASDLGNPTWALSRLGDWAEGGSAVWEPPAGLAGERRSHHFIDVAAAQLAAGDREGSLSSLQEARRIAPNHTRFHPVTRHTSETLVRLDRGRSEAVASFARWAGDARTAE